MMAAISIERSMTRIIACKLDEILVEGWNRFDIFGRILFKLFVVYE